MDLFPTLALIPNLGPLELVVIGIVALLLFGRRLPEVMRNLGRGIVEFKRGVRGIEDQVDQAASLPPQQPRYEQPVQPAPSQAAPAQAAPPMLPWRPRRRRTRARNYVRVSIERNPAAAKVRVDFFARFSPCPRVVAASARRQLRFLARSCR